MMMSKPESEKEAAPPPSALNVGSVADLERRLAEMGTQKKAATPTVAAPPVMKAPVAAAAAPPAVKGGKNALLVSKTGHGKLSNVTKESFICERAIDCFFSHTRP